MKTSEAFLLAAVAILGIVFFADISASNHLLLTPLYVLPVVLASLSGRPLMPWIMALASAVCATLSFVRDGIAAGSAFSLGTASANLMILLVVLCVAAGCAAAWVRQGLGMEPLRHDPEPPVSDHSQPLKPPADRPAPEAVTRESVPQSLGDSEAHYLSLVESLDINIIRKDREGRFTYASQSFCQRLGTTPDRLLGKTDFDLFPARLAQKYRADDIRVMESQQAINEVETNESPSGQWSYVQVIKTPILDSAGNVSGVQGIFWDVSDRMRAERQLRESEARKRAIFESAMDSIIFLDHAGRIVECNGAASHLLEYSRDQLVGQDFASLVVPEEVRDRFHDNVDRFGETGAAGSMLGKRLEIPLRTEAGAEFVAEISMQPIPLPEGAGFALFVRNISERKAAEATLHQAKEAAEMANRAKSMFVAEISHEIRTPMNAVIGFADMLLESQLSNDQREFLSIVHESAESLLSILNDVQDYSRIEAGTLNIDQVEFELRERLGNAVKTLANQAHTKGLELVFHVDSEVPDFLIGDSNRLRQVLLNMVGNAVKFTNHGEIVVHIDAQPSGEDEVELHVSVRDTGIAIPQSKQAAILAPFDPAEQNTSSRFGGTGLGLPISRRLIELMGGRLWLESEVRRGTTVHFTVRLGTTRREATMERLARARNLRGRYVLVVDDNATSRVVLEEQLRAWGVRVDTVTDGTQALEALQRAEEKHDEYDLVVIDEKMPGMDGFALVEAIRQQPALVPKNGFLMLLASSEHSGSVTRCEQLKLPAHLFKPIKSSELLLAMLIQHGPKPATRDGAGYGSGASRGLRILVAEDSIMNQKLAQGLLQKRGHQVTVANDGKQAVDAATAQNFDVIFMDVQMPEMDGLEATSRIREHERSCGRYTPIVAMTAHAMKGDEEQFLSAGMDGYISKPIRPPKLYETIDEMLKKGRQIRSGQR